MPEANAPDGVATALQPDTGAVVPRLKLGATGFNVLKTSNGRIYEEANAAFRMPARIKVVDEMRLSPPLIVCCITTCPEHIAPISVRSWLGISYFMS